MVSSTRTLSCGKIIGYYGVFLVMDYVNFYEFAFWSGFVIMRGLVGFP